MHRIGGDCFIKSSVLKGQVLGGTEAQPYAAPADTLRIAPGSLLQHKRGGIDARDRALRNLCRQGLDECPRPKADLQNAI